MRRPGIFFQRDEAAAFLRGRTRERLEPLGVEHAVKAPVRCPLSKRPQVLSVTQSTETGTVYTTEGNWGRLGEETARRLGLGLSYGTAHASAMPSQGLNVRAQTDHMAVWRRCSLLRRDQNGKSPWARLSCSSARSWRKNLNIAASRPASCRQKCASWPRPGSACWQDDAWLNHARRANALRVTPFGGTAQALTGLQLMAPTQANAVFATLPEDVLDYFEKPGLELLYLHRIRAAARAFMCAWDTTDADVDSLLDDIRTAAWLTARRTGAFL